MQDNQITAECPDREPGTNFNPASITENVKLVAFCHAEANRPEGGRFNQLLLV